MLCSMAALGLASALTFADPAWGTDPAAGDVSMPAATARPAAPDGPDGAKLFATNCAMCHKAPALARRLQGKSDLPGAKAEMRAFLARLGRSDADADAAIVDFLASQQP
jgi:cytochrome c5